MCEAAQQNSKFYLCFSDRVLKKKVYEKEDMKSVCPFYTLRKKSTWSAVKQSSLVADKENANLLQ